MVNYRVGTQDFKPRNKPRINSIIDIVFENDMILYVFPGSLSENDILIKFRDDNLEGTRIRQPSHIHWVVDILIKKDNNLDLTDNFLDNLLNRWDTISPLEERNYNSIMEGLILSRNTDFIEQYAELNNFGFFRMDFIIHLMELLMTQEKTNLPEAYMFREVIIKTIEGRDLYSIISKAIKRRSE